MDYKSTINYLLGQLPMFQRIGSAAYKDNLDNTIALDNCYGNPHRSFKTIHVAGTNGKGSVSHMLASVLQSAGYKVGLFTSPHLKDFRERIRVNGKKISKKEVTQFVDEFLSKNEILKLQPSFFEISVCMAFNHFKNSKIDIAVIEVGLGGRLDCTNIITPEISVITNISFDHVNILGDTLEKIAKEKAGIIKENIPVIIGETQPETITVFKDFSKSKNSKLLFADQRYIIEPIEDGIFRAISLETSKQYHLGLTGNYQQKNLATVLCSIDILTEMDFKIDKKSIEKGLKDVIKNTGLLGRWQQLGENPKIICDTGHNEGGIRFIVTQLKAESYKKLHIVFGMVSDKDINAVLELLPKSAVYYFTKASVERAMDENILKQKAEIFGLKGESYPTTKTAFMTAKNNASEEDLIFVGGSNFVVAEIL